MKRILLVEDEYVVRDGIKRCIDWEGEDLEFVGEASDGEVALEMFEKLRPDIVMTDIKMPFMDGLQLCREIKKISPETEIIILTGHADFEYAREGMKIGVARYLTKPIKPDEITEALRDVINKINERDESEKALREHMLEREAKLREYYKTASDKVYVDPIEMNAVDLKQIDRERIIEYLKLGDKSEVEEFVTETLGGISPNVMQSLIFRQYIIMDTYFTVCDFAENLGEERSAIEPPDVNSEVFAELKSAKEYIQSIIKAAMDMRDNRSFNRYDDIVRRTKEFVKENYGSADMSLNMAAESVGFSPNHLSSVFSQQTGQTFIKYLTEYRMDKAKEMLRCTSMRTSEIAASVGYEDPHYFSYIFKKNEGVTPSQFRG